MEGSVGQGDLGLYSKDHGDDNMTFAFQKNYFGGFMDD